MEKRMDEKIKKIFGEFEREHSGVISIIGKKTFEEIMILLGGAKEFKARNKIYNSDIDKLLDSALDDLEKIMQRAKIKDKFIQDLKAVILRIGVSVLLGSL